jgi:hypothetical protein
MVESLTREKAQENKKKNEKRQETDRACWHSMLQFMKRLDR